MGQRMINKGGERVIHDTIQAIQEAEAKADAIVKDADEKAEEMLAQAKQEAEEKRAAAVSEANAAAKQQLDAASVPEKGKQLLKQRFQKRWRH